MIDSILSKAELNKLVKESLKKVKDKERMLNLITEPKIIQSYEEFSTLEKIEFLELKGYTKLQVKKILNLSDNIMCMVIKTRMQDDNDITIFIEESIKYDIVGDIPTFLEKNKITREQWLEVVSVYSNEETHLISTLSKADKTKSLKELYLITDRDFYKLRKVVLEENIYSEEELEEFAIYLLLKNTNSIEEKCTKLYFYFENDITKTKAYINNNQDNFNEDLEDLIIFLLLKNVNNIKEKYTKLYSYFEKDITKTKAYINNNQDKFNEIMEDIELIELDNVTDFLYVADKYNLNYEETTNIFDFCIDNIEREDLKTYFKLLELSTKEEIVKILEDSIDTDKLLKNLTDFNMVTERKVDILSLRFN